MRSGKGNSENPALHKNLSRPRTTLLDDPSRLALVLIDHSSSSRGLRSKPSAMSAFSAVQVQVVAARAPAKVSAALICPHTHRTVAPIDGSPANKPSIAFYVIPSSLFADHRASPSHLPVP